MMSLAGCWRTSLREAFGALATEPSKHLPDPPMSSRRRFFIQSAALLATAALLSGCAGLGLTGQYAPRVYLAGIDSLPGEGLELRFMLKLRIQNPGDADLRYDGVWAEVELQGQPLASGGTAVTGVVPRFGEAVVMVPATASGLNIARQAISVLRSSRELSGAGMVAYALRGRLGRTGLGGGSFESSGEIDLRAP